MSCARWTRLVQELDDVDAYLANTLTNHKLMMPPIKLKNIDRLSLNKYHQNSAIVQYYTKLLLSLQTEPNHQAFYVFFFFTSLTDPFLHHKGTTCSPCLKPRP